jgi:hypothetical protein
MELANAVREYRDNFLHNVEGESGLARFEKMLNALGYKDTGLRLGSAVECFLSDNSGATEALIDWIAEQNSEEWADGLESQLPASELFCSECGQRMIVEENGVSHHLKEDGEIDHDADANHVPYHDEDEKA